MRIINAKIETRGKINQTSVTSVRYIYLILILMMGYSEWNRLECLDRLPRSTYDHPTIIGTQSTVSGRKMEENSHWDSPNMRATNSSGFSRIGTGFRDSSGIFDNMGSFGY